MSLSNWIHFLRDEIQLLLKSRNPLLWIAVGLWLSSALRTQYGNIYHRHSASDILTSVFFEIIGIVSLLCFLRWRGKLSYSFIALYALMAFVGTAILLYLYLKNYGLTLIQAETYLAITFLLDALLMTLSIPMFILAVQHLLFTIKMENKLKAMSVADLLRDHFEATRVYWECAKAKDSALVKIERAASLDSAWTMHELKKRDSHLEELIKGMGNSDDDVRNKAADEIITNYGESALGPLERNWKVRESRYFSKQPRAKEP
jgi:hypothetical protein